MINKIENWDKVEANYGEVKRLKADGYICVILACKQEVSAKSSKLMLVINFDIAEGDFKGYYMDRYKNAPRDNNHPQEPKWSGKYYIVLEGEGYEGRLKAFTTSLEESNQGYTWDWNEEALKGKQFGGIFREEEYLYNGEVRSNVKLWQVRSTKTIREGNFEVPRKKELPPEDKTLNNASLDATFMPITEDDLPF